jgi:signal transduction histidine kinase
VQRQLRESQCSKPSAGWSAASHDFNNLVASILSYSDLIQSLPPGDAHRDDVEEIKRAGRHAAELTRQLVAFSRQQVLQRAVINLNELVHDELACCSARRSVDHRPEAGSGSVAHEGRPM